MKKGFQIALGIGDCLPLHKQQSLISHMASYAKCPFLSSESQMLIKNPEFESLLHLYQFYTRVAPLNAVVFNCFLLF